MKYVKVPDERLVLLKNGTKERIEDETGTDVSIDDKVRTVSVHHEDSIKEMDAKRVIRAIGTGFEPHKALELIREPMKQFQTIDLRDETRNEKEFTRQKGRIIGENGKTKSLISELTGVMMKVYRDKVAFIGKDRDIRKAIDAVMSLINGTPHGKVYRELERYQSERIRALATRFYR